MKNETNCEVCGTKTKWGGKTCSRLCADELKKKNNREERTCIMCNKVFEVKKTTERTMCSDNCRKEWDKIPENRAVRIKNGEDAVMKKYGVKSTLQLEEVKEKIKITKKEKYGDENFVNYGKAKETNLERYGVEHILQVKEIRDKGKETKKELYGNEDYNNRNKAENTMLEKFGETHAMKLEEYQEKAKKTNLEKYGVSFTMQNKEIKQKAENTNIEKYGFKSPSSSEDIKNKIKNTYYNKFNQTKLFELLKNSNLNLTSEYFGAKPSPVIDFSYNEYKFSCTTCNSVFLGTFSNSRPPICRTCFPLATSGKNHLVFKEFLNDLKINFQENDRKTISPFELDFFISEKNIAFELDGNYYHSEIGGNKNKNYHFNKTLMCSKKNIKLIHIFEDELLLNKEIVQSRIKNLLGLSEMKIPARKCVIKEVNPELKKIFLKENHIQGNCVDKIRYGLFFKDELISIMTFSKNRIALGGKSNVNEWELIRFCSKLNYNIIGGFNRLLKHFIKHNNPKKITTYADSRWSGIIPEDTVYCKNNFKFIHQSKPNYWYFINGNYLNRNHRFKFNKQKISKISNKENPKQYSEWELAQFLKMDRIWDCGSMKFEMVF